MKMIHWRQCRSRWAASVECCWHQLWVALRVVVQVQEEQHWMGKSIPAVVYLQTERPPPCLVLSYLSLDSID